MNKDIYNFILYEKIQDFKLYDCQRSSMTFHHEFSYSFSFSFSSFLGGKRKGGGERKTKVVIKRHTFLLDHCYNIFSF